MLVPDYHLVVPLVVRLGLVAPKGNCIFFPISPKLVSEIKWICLKAQDSLCFTLTQLTNLWTPWTTRLWGRGPPPQWRSWSRAPLRWSSACLQGWWTLVLDHLWVWGGCLVSHPSPEFCDMTINDSNCVTTHNFWSIISISGSWRSITRPSRC